MSVPEFRWILLVAMLVMMSGCAAYSVVSSDRYSNTSAIPHDERPPAGQCRLWYNDRRVSEQPPAGDCEQMERNQPDNARLIRG